MKFKKVAIKAFFAQQHHEAHPVTNRKNSGSGTFVPNFDKLQRLVEEHGENMEPIQKMAVFFLQNLEKLSHKNPSEDEIRRLKLTCHHCIPLAGDCDGSDHSVSTFEVYLKIIVRDVSLQTIIF